MQAEIKKYRNKETGKIVQAVQWTDTDSLDVMRELLKHRITSFELVWEGMNPNAKYLRVETLGDNAYHAVKGDWGILHEDGIVTFFFSPQSEHSPHMFENYFDEYKEFEAEPLADWELGWYGYSEGNQNSILLLTDHTADRSRKWFLVNMGGSIHECNWAHIRQALSDTNKLVKLIPELETCCGEGEACSSSNCTGYPAPEQTVINVFADCPQQETLSDSVFGREEKSESRDWDWIPKYVAKKLVHVGGCKHDDGRYCHWDNHFQLWAFWTGDVARECLRDHK